MAVYKPVPIQIENALDEFGKLLSIPRLPLESNLAYKRRVLTSAKNWGGSHKQGLINSISSELGARVYTVEDKAYYFLTKEPILKDPSDNSALSVAVYVNDQEFSDYDVTGSPVNSYKLWKLSNGTPTRLVEFKTIPPDKAVLRFEYYYLSDGIPTLWRDIGSDENPSFLGMKAQTPTSADIEVFELHDPTFQTTYLLDSQGKPNATYKAIVAELHHIYPLLWGEWRWGKTFWDVADDDIVAIDHLPNSYDLSTLFLTSGDYEAGVGYGSDCSITRLLVDHRGSTTPVLSPGYLYIDGEEYYLYGSKYFGPVSGDLFYTTSPVVATKASSSRIAESSRSPFTKTWERGYSDIFRRTVQLSGSRWVYMDSEWTQVPDSWFSIDPSGVISVSGTYVASDFIWQYDAGGDYICPVELNPIFSPVYANKILGIQKKSNAPNWSSYTDGFKLSINPVDVYMKRVTSATYDSLAGGGFYPDFDGTVRAEAANLYGVPLKGWDLDNATLGIKLKVSYAGTSISSTTQTAGIDGSTVFHYADLFNRAVTDPKGIVISGVLVDTSTEMASTTTVRVIPLGVAK